MFGNKLNEEELASLAELVKDIAMDQRFERASMCAYDCLSEAAKGKFAPTFDAWKREQAERTKGSGHSDTVRNGIWVPAIPLA